MSITTIFNMTRDVSGQNGFGTVTSTATYGVSLPLSTLKTVTVPSDQANYIAIFSYDHNGSTNGGKVFVNSSGTATVYTTTVTATETELNPDGRKVKAGDVISMITPNDLGATVQVSFFVVAPYSN